MILIAMVVIFGVDFWILISSYCSQSGCFTRYKYPIWISSEKILHDARSDLHVASGAIINTPSETNNTWRPGTSTPLPLEGRRDSRDIYCCYSSSSFWVKGSSIGPQRRWRPTYILTFIRQDRPLIYLDLGDWRYHSITKRADLASTLRFSFYQRIASVLGIPSVLIFKESERIE